MSDLPVLRFRLHGVRKLNWVRRDEQDYEEHLSATGFDTWIEPGPLSIVVGPNDGGKTTVLDLMRAIANARVWPTLGRENYPAADFSGFEIVGSNFHLKVIFSRFTPEDIDPVRNVSIQFNGRRGDYESGPQTVIAPRDAGQGEWLSPIQSFIDNVVTTRVHVLSANAAMPAAALDDRTLVGLLNELAPRLPSVWSGGDTPSFRVSLGYNGALDRIGVLFRDDRLQPSLVSRENLPMGWLQLAAVVHFMRGCTRNSLVLLDEPDAHLHPSLQRVMLEIVAQEGRQLGAQVVVATHSSVLMNPSLCERTGARVIVAARGRCEHLTDHRRVLDDLGVMSGDLVQANGIIWVEGPSDRLYVKHWLELFADAHSLPVPIEGTEYAFVSYSGALLKHLTLEDNDPKRVSLPSINRNFALLIDRDKSGLGGLVDGDEKQRVLSEAKRHSNAPIWVTERYTIENYLPPDWPLFDKHIVSTPDGRTRVNNITKVRLAEAFRDQHVSWADSFDRNTKLADRIGELLERIRRWQNPHTDET